MEKKDKIIISIWAIATAIVAAVCGVAIWWTSLLFYSDDGYHEERAFRVGIYSTQDEKVAELFGEEIYAEIIEKKKDDCAGDEIMNYIIASRVFRLRGITGKTFDTRVTSVGHGHPYKFNVAIYNVDEQALYMEFDFIEEKDCVRVSINDIDNLLFKRR